MDKSVRIFSSPYELAEFFAGELVFKIKKAAKKNEPLTVALSGGSTPEILFSVIGDHFSKSAPWKYVHFFWGDERCVPPENPESNYGMTRARLFEKIDIPSSNIHRILGENDPYHEALRYSEEISAFTEKKRGLPSFGLVMLGMGEDGHTASIFSGNSDLLMTSEKICEVAVHPLTSQKRITVTGKVINNADSVCFIVTGKKKAEIIEEVLNKKKSAAVYPVSKIMPVSGELKWYIDVEAGGLL